MVLSLTNVKVGKESQVKYPATVHIGFGQGTSIPSALRRLNCVLREFLSAADCEVSIVTEERKAASFV